MRHEEFYQIEGCGHPHTQCILEFLVGTFIYPFHQRQSIVDDDIHLIMLAKHLACESLQHLFLSDIANKVLALLLVYHMDNGRLRAELIGNSSAYAVGTTGYNDYFILECICYHKPYSITVINMIRPSDLTNI